MVLILTKGLLDFFPEIIERVPVMANCSEKREMISSVDLQKCDHLVTLSQSVCVCVCVCVHVLSYSVMSNSLRSHGL